MRWITPSDVQSVRAAVTFPEDLHGNPRAISVGEQDFTSPYEVLVGVVAGTHLRDRQIEDFWIEAPARNHSGGLFAAGEALCLEAGERHA